MFALSMMAICLYYFYSRHSKIYPDTFGSKKEKNPLLIRIKIKKKEVLTAATPRLAPSSIQRDNRVSNNHSLSIACPYFAL
jgi:hypothetical protein